MENGRILNTFHNEETNMSSFVVKNKKGFAVSLKDNDSGLFLPTVMIYANYDLGVIKAQKAIGLN